MYLSFLWTLPFAIYIWSTGACCGFQHFALYWRWGRGSCWPHEDFAALLTIGKISSGPLPTNDTQISFLSTNWATLNLKTLCFVTQVTFSSPCFDHNLSALGKFDEIPRFGSDSFVLSDGNRFTDGGIHRHFHLDGWLLGESNLGGGPHTPPPQKKKNEPITIRSCIQERCPLVKGCVFCWNLFKISSRWTFEEITWCCNWKVEMSRVDCEETRNWRVEIYLYVSCTSKYGGAFIWWWNQAEVVKAAGFTDISALNKYKLCANY